MEYKKDVLHGYLGELCKDVLYNESGMKNFLKNYISTWMNVQPTQMTNKLGTFGTSSLIKTYQKDLNVSATKTPNLKEGGLTIFIYRESTQALRLTLEHLFEII